MAESNGAKLNLVVLTVGRKVYEGEVDSVTGKGTGGEFTILHKHMAYMTPLEIGVLTVRNGSNEERIALHAGFLRVENDTVTVLADAGEKAHDIDVERARAAKRRAEDRLGRPAADDTDIDRARAGLQRALIRLRIVGQ